MFKVLEIGRRKRQDKKMKGPTDIASYRASRNLVKSWPTPDVDSILTRIPTSSTSPSRSQRRINVDRVSFRKGAVVTAVTSINSGPLVHKASAIGSPSWLATSLVCRPFTKADSYSRCFSQFVPYTDCFRMAKGPAVRVGLLAYTASDRVNGCLSNSEGSWQHEDARPAITKAVCSTQTRMPRGLKSAETSKPGNDQPCQPGGWRRNANHTYVPGGVVNHPVEGIMSGIKGTE